MCLQVPFLFHKQQQIDNVFVTCCILHNMIIEMQGREPEWEGMGVHAAGGIGAFDDEINFFSVFTSRLHAFLRVTPTTDCSGVGSLRVPPAVFHEESQFVLLQKSLVTHFDQMWRRGKVEWMR